MAASAWQLTPDQRQETVKRTAENLFVLAYSRGAAVSDKEAAEIAKKLESSAYTVARIESQTTSGHRPAEESVKAYARKLSSLLIEWLKKSADNESGKTHTSSQSDGQDSQVFDLTGERMFMTKESAEEAFAPLFREGASVKRIKLSTKSFAVEPDNSVEVVVRAIQTQADSLTDVDMSDIIAGRPEHEALETLRLLSQACANLKLQRLDLSDNALGEKGLRACAAAIQDQDDLQFLGLRNVGCSINACAALKQLLNRSSNLTSLHFYNNMTDDQGACSIAELKIAKEIDLGPARIVARAPQMRDFKIVSSRVGPEGGIALAQALQTGKNLERLELSDNVMTEEVAPELDQLIKTQPNLKALLLNDLGLCDEGVIQIAEALQDSAHELEELELALNEITPASAKSLAVALAKKTKLKRLVLRENELKDRGAVWIANGIAALKSLEHVDFSQNELKTAGALAIAKGVSSSKTTLKSLELDENNISEEGIAQLKETLDNAAIAQTLGSLEENDPDGDGDEDDDDDDEAKEGQDSEADELSKAFAGAAIK